MRNNSKPPLEKNAGNAGDGIGVRARFQNYARVITVTIIHPSTARFCFGSGFFWSVCVCECVFLLYILFVGASGGSSSSSSSSFALGMGRDLAQRLLPPICFHFGWSRREMRGKGGMVFWQTLIKSEFPTDPRTKCAMLCSAQMKQCDSKWRAASDEPLRWQNNGRRTSPSPHHCPLAVVVFCCCCCFFLLLLGAPLSLSGCA